jgi:two-component system, OmpR family, phosphate regulon sensor histidine kinase PhoR
MSRRNLLWQFFFAYTAIGVAAMLVAGFFAARTARNVYLDDVWANLERGANNVAEVLADPPDMPSDREVIQPLCRHLGHLLGMRVTVVAADGTVLGDSEEDPERMENHRGRQEIGEALEGNVGRAIRPSPTQHEERVYAAVAMQDKKPSPLVVRTSVPVRTLAGTLHAAYLHIALACAGLAVIVAAASYWASRRILRPLEQIRAGADRLAHGELQHRLRIHDATEIAVLAESLNQMAEQLDQRIRTVVRQENELEAILSSMEEGVLAVDNASTIINVNEACARMLGAPAESLRGRLVHEAVRRTDLIEFIASTLAGSTPREADLQWLAEPDRWFHANSTALYDADRRKIGALVVLHDVTRLRHLENVRRDFVANVSHELRTPITSIQGFVETVLDESLEDKEAALRHLKIVLRQAERLSSIIDDLLSLSYIERGADAHAIPVENAPLGEVLRSALEMCEKKAVDKQMTLSAKCPEDLMAPINGPLLEQAVMNLVDNAIKYSPAGAAVCVEAEREASDVVIRVRDQGCGIGPQHLPRLFERFYRVDKARSRELGGTGLGLSIVKHIVAAHRGTVHVESTLGKGSTFVIRLPAPA